MLKNIAYFALLNFVALAAIIVISEAMVFLGTFTASLLAATGLYFRIKKANQLLSRPQLILTAAACSAISTAICLSFEYLLFGEFEHSLLTLSLISFFFIFIFVLLTLKIVYQKADENFEQYPLTNSPAAKALLKFWGKISTSNYSALTDEELIRLSITLTPLMCSITIFISALLCSVIWLFLNRSIIEYPILAISSMALIIVLMHIWSVNRYLVKKELEHRFLNNKGV